MDPAKPAPDVLNDRAVDYGEPVLAPADVFDPVLEAYKQDVDRTLLRENLKLTPQERSEKLVSFMRGLVELRRAEMDFRRSRG